MDNNQNNNQNVDNVDNNEVENAEQLMNLVGETTYQSMIVEQDDDDGSNRLNNLIQQQKNNNSGYNTPHNQNIDVQNQVNVVNVVQNNVDQNANVQTDNSNVVQVVRVTVQGQQQQNIDNGMEDEEETDEDDDGTDKSKKRGKKRKASELPRPRKKPKKKRKKKKNTDDDDDETKVTMGGFITIDTPDGFINDIDILRSNANLWQHTERKFGSDDDRQNFVKGKYTKAEAIVLKESFDRYCQKNGLDPQVAIPDMCSRENRDRGSKGGFGWIINCLPHRKTNSIYQYCCRHFSGKKTGKWAPDEVLRLRKEYERLGPKWAAISRILNRNPDSCRDKWRLIKANFTRGAWSFEEDKTLTKIIYEIGHSVPEQGILWSVVSDKMGTRSHSACRNRYYDVLVNTTYLEKLFEYGSGRSWTEFDDKDLMQKIKEQKCDGEEKIDWSTIFPNGKHSEEVCKAKFKKFKERYTNSHKEKVHWALLMERLYDEALQMVHGLREQTRVENKGSIEKYKTKKERRSSSSYVNESITNRSRVMVNRQNNHPTNQQQVQNVHATNQQVQNVQNVQVQNVHPSNQQVQNVHATNQQHPTNQQVQNVQVQNVHPSNQQVQNVHRSNQQVQNVHRSNQQVQNMHPVNQQVQNVHPNQQVQNTHPGNQQQNTQHSGNQQQQQEPVLLVNQVDKEALEKYLQEEES